MNLYYITTMESLETAKESVGSHEKKGDVAERLIELINETIKNPWDTFSNRINYMIEKALNWAKKDGNIMDPWCQKRVFDEVVSFLNSLFKECRIKKFYNNIPSLNISQYEQKDLGGKFVNNIYGKERKLFYKKDLKWGSCHHWTILLENLFELLKKNWLLIESRIIAYNTKGGHSAVLLRFQWEEYIADIHGFNESSKKVINSTKELNKIYWTNEFSNFSFKKTHDGTKYYFNTTKEFAEYIEKREQTTGVIEFRPRLESNEEKDIKIEFWKGGLSLSINGEMLKYTVDNFTADKSYKNPYDAIEYFLKHTHWPKEHKQELGKYLTMIVTKVNREKIYNIYKQ